MDLIKTISESGLKKIIEDKQKVIVDQQEKIKRLEREISEINKEKREITYKEIINFTNEYIEGLKRCNITTSPQSASVMRDFAGHVNSYLSVYPKIWSPK